MHTRTVPGRRDRNAAARESSLACRCTFAALDDVATRPGQSPFREYVHAPSRELRGEVGSDYLAALAPAAAATPSCCPVPPLAPTAPMILPLTTIGTPPSDATGLSGKVMKAVLPAAY